MVLRPCLYTTHVTQSEHHRRGRHVLLGVVVDQQEQTFLTKLLGCCQQCHRSGDCMLHPGSHGGGGSYMSSEEAAWAKSFMQRMGFVMRKAAKTAKKLPPNSEEQLKESYDIFDGGGEQHSG